MSDIEALAIQLAEARKSKGLSQTGLAEKLGMKQSQISDIETGKRNIRIGTLIEVARGVGLEVVLVPRPLLPAVSYVTRPGKLAGQISEETSMYELWTEEE